MKFSNNDAIAAVQILLLAQHGHGSMPDLLSGGFRAFFMCYTKRLRLLTSRRARTSRNSHPDTLTPRPTHTFDPETLTAIPSLLPLKAN
jgi:hypothetical protein